MSDNRLFRAHALVIDDNRVDAALLEEILKEFGCNVDVSDDRRFIERMENIYDIVFVDINMPSMDGFMLASTIRQSSLKIKSVPIIAVSSKNYSPEQVEKTLKNGLDGYIEKPASMPILEDILSEFLADKEVVMHKFSKEGDLRLKGFYRKRKHQ